MTCLTCKWKSQDLSLSLTGCFVFWFSSFVFTGFLMTLAFHVCHSLCFQAPQLTPKLCFPSTCSANLLVFFPPKIFDMEHFKSLYWICYNTASISCLGFFGYKACGILVPWPGFKPAPPACCCLVTQSCPTLCNPLDCSMPDFPVLHYYPEFAQTLCPLSQWCHPTIPSSVIPISSCPQSLQASRSFPMC